MRGLKVVTGAAAVVLLLVCMGPTPVLADTIEAAMVRAYQNNPQLNAQRAQVRSTDENVPQALSGYRPKVAVTASAGYQYTDTNLTSGGTPNVIVRTGIHGTNAPRSVGATVSQTLFNGQQTANRTRAAESQVSSAREGLRVLEQTVLLSAATIYMDYLRDAAIVEVQRSNVRVLEQTLKQTQDRFNVGEVTRTDVAQSEAQLAAGKTQLLTAEANLTTTRANFRRIIGNEPENLAPGSPVDRFLPATLSKSVELGLTENPNVTAAMYGVDVSFLQVKVNEGALFPTVTLQTSVQQSYEQTLTIFRSFGASTAVQLNGSGLPGRCGIFADPSVQGNAGAAASQSRADPRPGARQCCYRLGTTRGGQGAGGVGASAGDRLRNRVERRARRGQGRAAHHARRPERAAGAGQRAQRARYRAARSRGRILFGADLDWADLAASAQPRDHDL